MNITAIGPLKVSDDNITSIAWDIATSITQNKLAIIEVADTFAYAIELAILQRETRSREDQWRVGVFANASMYEITLDNNMSLTITKKEQ